MSGSEKNSPNRFLHSPRFPRVLLRLLLERDAWIERTGDLEEIFAARAARSGARRAALWFWLQILAVLPRLAGAKLLWRIRMLTHYLRAAFRGLRRHPGFASINIAGLALGLACCLLISTYIRHETGFDDYHPDLERVYRLAMHFEHPSLTIDFAKVGPAAAPRLRADFPQVERAARMLRPPRVLIRRDEAVFYENRFYYAEPDLFDILDLRVAAGDPGAAFAAPDRLALSRAAAEKYFGGEDPLGKTLSVDGKDYEIAALLENPLPDTHLKCDFLASFKTIEKPEMIDSWGWTNFPTYLKLIPGTGAKRFGEQIARLEDLYREKGGDGREKFQNRYFLQPVRSIHLHSHLAGETESPGSLKTMSVAGAVGLTVLLIACFNFTNLTTARFVHRAREAGMRRVVGARRGQLVFQFLAESFLTVLLAFFAALLLARLALPVLNGLTVRAFGFADLAGPASWPGFVFLWVTTALAAGAYPALFLAGFHPAAVLKGGLGFGKGTSVLRRILVVAQFSVTIVLLIGALTVRRQLDFVRRADLGFIRGQKLVLPLHGDFSDNVRHEQIKNAFLRLPGVSGATASLGVPGRIIGAWATALVKGYDDRGDEIVVEEDFRRMFYFAADLDFFPQFGLSLAAGRSFERSDFDNSLIVNQRALRDLGLDSAEAALDRIVMTGYGRPGRIVGVVRDFHYEGMQAGIEPLVITCGTGGHPANQFNSLTLTVTGPDLPATLAAVESAWKARFPEFPYSYRFLDEIFDEWYRAERGTERMLTIFMLLGLSIAALGLFGLASFTAERRTREIGIRKVLGASTPSVVLKLGWEFFRWVLIANLIAWPAAWLIMRGWLDGFAYRTSLGVGVFGAAAFVTLAVAGAAVTRQSLRAARTDPASTLRYE